MKQFDHKPGQRISIVGSTGSGKTTLGQQLESILGYPYLELDSIHWLAGWQEMALEDFRRQVGEFANREQWVMDGNYSKVRDLVWPRAETVIWLDFSFGITFWRLFWRTLQRGLSKEKLWNTNTESIRMQFFSKESLFLWLFESYPRNKKRYPHELALPQYAHLQLLHFRRPREVKRWLNWLAENASGPEKT